jgi:hypothetical protein
MSEIRMRSSASPRRWLGGLAVVVALLTASLACSLGQALVDQPAPGPTATKTRVPTFTPLPGAATAQSGGAEQVRGALPPGVTAIVPSGPMAGGSSATLSGGASSGEGTTGLVLFATLTPPATVAIAATATLGPTPLPTGDVETNRPTREAGPRALPTPYVVVSAATLSGRRGPATTFASVGKVASGDELMILGQVPGGQWWLVCCVSNQPVWVPATDVNAKGPLDAIPVLTPAPTPAPPPPAPRPLPSLTPLPSPTPMPPFDVARGPEFPWKEDNGQLTVWVKVFEGQAPYEVALGGYVLKVLRDGVDVSATDQSRGDAPFDHIDPKTSIYPYNLKYQLPGASEADWQIYLATPDGTRVSPITKFTTKGDSYRNLVVYIAYWKAR